MVNRRMCFRRLGHFVAGVLGIFYFGVDKREGACKRFLESIKRFETLMIEAYAEVNEEKQKNLFRKLDEMRMDFPIILAEVDLYTDRNLSTKCQDLFFNRCNVWNNHQKFQEDYDQLVDAMKESLKN